MILGERLDLDSVSLRRIVLISLKHTVLADGLIAAW